ncbi:YdcF family protein [Nocardiopsis halophila]|uniref:YdcF family protein n=1 Tax=Nocardiopsis halophila TaxID=141692 RepID=UPI00034D14F0|nr:YdcF family protein [Nocardiopsis halophila]
MKVRTAGEGRADDPREGGPGGSPDAEATRVFERSRPVGGAEATRVFTRDAAPVPEPVPGPLEELDGPDGPDAPEGPRGPGGPGEGEGPAGRGGGGGGPRSRGPRRRFRLRPGRIIALLLVVAIAVPPGTWAWVWWTARQDARPPSDAILVLGASQYNGRPSPIFEARLEHAAHLYEEGVAPTVITVGGNQPGDNYTEGGAGRDWLVEQGVPAGSVVAVEEGSNTLRSLEAVDEVVDANGWQSVVIVSDPWHSLRSRIMAEDQGMEAATSPVRSGPAVLERRTQLWYITRETGALWYYWLFGDTDDADIGYGTDAA